MNLDTQTTSRPMPNRLTTAEQPRLRGIVFRGRPATSLPPDPNKPDPINPRPDRKGKPYRDQTWTEKWWGRRHRWFKVLSTRVPPFEKAFDDLMNVADKETYEFTEEEAASLVAHFQAWVDALEQSLQARKVIPRNIPPVDIDRDAEPPGDAIPVNDALKDIW